MLRKPKWQTLVVLVACVVLTGHFLDKLTPRSAPTCPKAIILQQGSPRRDSTLSVDHTPVRPLRGPDPLALPEAKVPKFRDVPDVPDGRVSDGGRRPEARVLDLPGARILGHVIPGLGHANSSITRGIPMGWDPIQFELISEMNSTLHLRPWDNQDLAQDLCKKKEWYALGALPDVSVIISFHNNEELYNIIHTLHAVVKRTPAKLLREIILIDDNTQKDEFGQILEIHIRANFGKLVRLVRSKVDLGLIQARLNGIRAALGKVVVLMDSHVEPQPGWLEALLYEIVRDRRTLASPFLDWMRKTDRIWTYRHGASTWLTYFDWSLTFGFQDLSAEKLAARSDRTQPIRSPVTVGTFAIDKAWFKEVGAFDEGMQKWGGENLDLALRVWLFGGQVINVPCSHVSHLEKDGVRDYRNGWTDIIQTNYKRFVEVWLDEYKKYFYLHLPHVEAFEAGDLSSRIALKSKAKHNFTWFLQNVFPELGVPDMNVYAYGGLQSLGGRCFDTMYSMTPALSKCSPQLIATQGIFWTKEGLLRLPMNIVTAEQSNGFTVVKVYEYTSYYNNGRASKWFHVENGPLIELNTGKCLEVGRHSKLRLSKCKHMVSQYWRFRYYSEDYTQLSTTGEGVPEEFKLYLPLVKTMNQSSSRETASFPFFDGQEP